MSHAARLRLEKAPAIGVKKKFRRETRLPIDDAAGERKEPSRVPAQRKAILAKC